MRVPGFDLDQSTPTSHTVNCGRTEAKTRNISRINRRSVLSSHTLCQWRPDTERVSHRRTTAPHLPPDRPGPVWTHLSHVQDTVDTVCPRVATVGKTGREVTGKNSAKVRRRRRARLRFPTYFGCHGNPGRRHNPSRRRHSGWKRLRWWGWGVGPSTNSQQAGLRVYSCLISPRGHINGDVFAQRTISPFSSVHPRIMRAPRRHMMDHVFPLPVSLRWRPIESVLQKVADQITLIASEEGASQRGRQSPPHRPPPLHWPFREILI